MKGSVWDKRIGLRRYVSEVNGERRWGWVVQMVPWRGVTGNSPTLPAALRQLARWGWHEWRWRREPR